MNTNIEIDQTIKVGQTKQQDNKIQNEVFGQDEITLKVEDHYVQDPEFEDFDKFGNLDENQSQNQEDKREKNAISKSVFKVFSDQSNDKQYEKKIQQTQFKDEAQSQQIKASPITNSQQIPQHISEKQTTMSQDCQKQLIQKDRPDRLQKLNVEDYQNQNVSGHNGQSNIPLSNEQNTKVIENQGNINSEGDNIKVIEDGQFMQNKNSAVQTPLSQKPQELVLQKVQSQTIQNSISIDLLSNYTIIKQAQKQRMISTYDIFKQYKKAYEKNVQSYKLIINNISFEILNKKDMKKTLHQNLLSYFVTCSNVNKQFHQKSYKIKKEQSDKSVNKYINIKEQLKNGYEGFIYLRKIVADEQKKLETLINNSIIKGINDHFERYNSELRVAENIFVQIKNHFIKKQTNLQKLLINIEAIFKKSLNGKHKQDIFTWIVKYLKEQRQYRKQLIIFGRSITQLRQAYITNQKQLFTNIQQIINEFKTQSSKLYSYKQKFSFVENYIDIIQGQNRYELLCTITDLDYIKSVLQLHGKKQNIKFTDQHFLTYLQLSFFDKFVGDIKDIFRSSMFKSFQLRQKNCFIIHTVSGNLIKFNQEKYQCQDKFTMDNIDVNIIDQEGRIQIEQNSKTFIFNSVRKVVLEMVNSDKAEEIVCYLSQKNEIKRNQDNKI